MAEGDERLDLTAKDAKKSIECGQDMTKQELMVKNVKQTTNLPAPAFPRTFAHSPAILLYASLIFILKGGAF